MTLEQCCALPNAVCALAWSWQCLKLVLSASTSWYCYVKKLSHLLLPWSTPPLENVIQDLHCNQKRPPWDTNFSLTFCIFCRDFNVLSKLRNHKCFKFNCSWYTTLDVVGMTVVSDMTIIWGTCKQDSQGGIPCCPNLCCLIIFPFHLVQNELIKQNSFIYIFFLSENEG